MKEKIYILILAVRECVEHAAKYGLINILYADYIIRHKTFVLQECWKRGLYWRGIWHDLDKFSPWRWIAYRNKFYGNETPEVKEKFNEAWRTHAAKNDHHWQYWCSLSDDGKIRVHEMTDRARKEMIADWIGAHKAIGGTDLLSWYNNREATIMIAAKTKRLIKIELTNLKE